MVNKENIQSLVEEYLRDTDYELITLEISAANEILIEIDRLAGVDVEDCGKLNNWLVEQLDAETGKNEIDEKDQQLLDTKIAEYEAFLQNDSAIFTVEQLEEAMQKVMDNYAGGISTHYQFNGKQLALAKEKINHLIELTGDLYASDMHELMFIYELKERLTVCLSVIAHLGARKETRWHSFAENLDYPDKSDDWMKYVNSRYENGQLHMIYRELVGREARYEHND